jgi:O-antigen ligase
MDRALARDEPEESRILSRALPLGPGRLLKGALLGVAAASGALALSGLETRYLVAIMVVIVAAGAMLLLGSAARARAVMIVAIVLGLSVGLSISFLSHRTTAGTYVPFVGGAEGITLSLSICGCLGYIVTDRMDPMRRRWRICPLLFWSPILFMAASLPSLLNAIDPTLSVLEEIRLASLLLIMVVVMNLTGREVRLYTQVLAASVILQASLVVVQWTTGQSLGMTVLGEAQLTEAQVAYESVLRPTGTLGDPNIVAYFFEITGPIVLALAYAARSGRERAIFIVAVMSALVGAALTLSRAAWLLLPFGCAIVALAIPRRRPVTFRTLFCVCGGLLLAAPLIIAVWPMIAGRLFGDDAGSGGHRLPLIAAAWSVLSQFPTFGAGLNNFAIAFERLDLTGYSRVFVGVDHVVHNLHLLVWTEVGTVGFIAYLWYFGSGFLAAFRLRTAEPWARAVAFGTAAGLLCHLLHGLVDPGFKLSLTISQLIAAQMGLLGCLLLRRSAKIQGRGDAPS